MSRPLSSRATLFYKLVFPALWIAGFGVGTVLSFRAPDEIVYDGVAGGAPPAIGWLFLLMWILGTAFILWAVVPLRRVRVDGDALWVAGLGSEYKVPLELIEEVTQNRWVNIRPITLRLRTDVAGVGNSIRFIPPFRVRWAAWREDPIVEEIRQLAAAHPQRPSAR